MNTTLLVTLVDAFRAQLLQDLLTNEGIESFMKNETISSVINAPGFHIEIFVYEKDYAKATEIFKEGFPDLVKN